MKSTSVRKPYTGSRRALVVALDVGTTFSGVSYAILEPGEVPKIHGVTRFPGQEHVAGNSKIPTVMWYSKSGRMKRAGAEADSSTVLARAEDEGWTKAELFKLRLRPRAMKLKMNGMRLPALPQGKTAVEIFGDFLAYLFHCTRTFIEDTHANGPALWKAVERNINFVLSHPNGWEGAQQSKMRRAAIYARLIPNTDEGKSRIRFVTEGEASLHACVLNGLAADVLSNPSEKHGFLVLDAGGGTLDISSYAVRGTAPLVIEEIAPPDCVFAGAVFVSRRARAFLEVKLRGSKYGSPDSLDHITRRFDESTKRLFRDKKESQFVPFGSPLDKDLPFGIRGGQLKLNGADVADLFEPSVNAAIASIRAQIEASGDAIKSVWLVGGFASSPWLFLQLQERLAPLGLTVSRPDSQTSKAVADGAVGFYCDHHVSARMSKYMYGVEFLREVDPLDTEHVARQGKLCELPSGPKLLPDAFDCILARSVKVKESTVFSRKYSTEISHLSSLAMFEVEIWCYKGGHTVPKWILRDSEEFSTLCVVQADLSPLKDSAQREIGPNGKEYWKIVFRIEIQFGLTEFHARIKWVHNGKVEYGPATIVFNESGMRVGDDIDDSGPDDESVSLSRDQSVVGGSPERRAPPDAPLPRAEPPASIIDRPVSIAPAAPEIMSRSPSHSTTASHYNAPPRSARDRSLSTTGRSTTDSKRSSALGNTLRNVWGGGVAHSGQASPRPELEYVDYPPQPQPRSNGPGTPGPPSAPIDSMLFDPSPVVTAPPAASFIEEVPAVMEIAMDAPVPVFDSIPVDVAPPEPISALEHEPEPTPAPPPEPEPVPEPDVPEKNNKSGASTPSGKKGKKSGKNTPKVPMVVMSPIPPPQELPSIQEEPTTVTTEPESVSAVGEPAFHEASTPFSFGQSTQNDPSTSDTDFWGTGAESTAEPPKDEFAVASQAWPSRIGSEPGAPSNLPIETEVQAAQPEREPELLPEVVPETPTEDWGGSATISGKKKKKGKGSGVASSAEPSSPWGASKAASPFGQTSKSSWDNTPSEKLTEAETLQAVDGNAGPAHTMGNFEDLALDNAPSVDKKDDFASWDPIPSNNNPDHGTDGGLGGSWVMAAGEGISAQDTSAPQPGDYDLGGKPVSLLDTWDHPSASDPPAGGPTAPAEVEAPLDDLTAQLLAQLDDDAKEGDGAADPPAEDVTKDDKDEEGGGAGKKKKKNKKKK